MNNNVLVTGMPRSGTSITMRILMALGYNRIGNQFVRHCLPEFNPDGFEELNEEEYPLVARMLVKSKGNCVKIFGNYIGLLKPKSIDKIIFCTREMENAIQSAQNMFSKQKELRWGGNTYKMSGTRSEASRAVKNNAAASERWLAINNKKYYISRLETLKNNPRDAINNIVEYLGEGNNIESAIALVRS